MRAFIREIVSCDMDVEAYHTMVATYHSCHKWKTQGFHDPEQGKKVLLTQVGGKWRECELSFCLFVLLLSLAPG